MRYHLENCALDRGHIACRISANGAVSGLALSNSAIQLHMAQPYAAQPRAVKPS